MTILRHIGDKATTPLFYYLDESILGGSMLRKGAAGDGDDDL